MAKRERMAMGYGIMIGKRLGPVVYMFKPILFEGERAVPVEIHIARPAKGKRKGAKR